MVAEIERALDCATCRPEVQEEWARQLRDLATGACFEGRELFASYFTDPLPSLLDYFGPGDLILLDEPEAVRLAAGELERTADELYAELTTGGELPPEPPPPLPPLGRTRSHPPPASPASKSAH